MTVAISSEKRKSIEDEQHLQKQQSAKIILLVASAAIVIVAVAQVLIFTIAKNKLARLIPAAVIPLFVIILFVVFLLFFRHNNKQEFLGWKSSSRSLNDGNDRMALVNLAVETDDSFLLKRLIELDADLVLKDRPRDVPLHTAARKGNVCMLELLLESSPSTINNQNCYNETPLYCAIDHDNVAAAKLLLQHGADITLKSNSGYLPLHLAIKSIKFNDVVPLLINDQIINSEDGVHALYIAAIYGNIKSFKLLYKKGVDLNATDRYKNKAIVAAARGGKKDIMDLLLSDPRTDINFQDRLGFTALQIACGVNNVEIVRLLLKQSDIDTNIKNEGYYGFTALHIACKENNVDVVGLLLKQSDIDINAKASLGFTALHIACSNNNVDIVRLLLKQSDIDINIKNEDYSDFTALHIACKENNLDIARLLLKQSDIDINTKAYLGFTALHTACSNNNVDIVRLLIKRDDTDVNAKAFLGLTALHIACENNNFDIVRLLLERSDTDVNAKNEDIIRFTALHMACEKNNFSIVELLLKRGDVDLNVKNENRFGFTALHIACEKNNFDIVELLLKQNGIDVNVKNNPGGSALCTALFARWYGDSEGIIKLLLEHGACIDFDDIEKMHESVCHPKLWSNISTDDPNFIRTKELLNEFEQALKQGKKIELSSRSNVMSDTNVEHVETLPSIKE